MKAIILLAIIFRFFFAEFQDTPELRKERLAKMREQRILQNRLIDSNKELVIDMNGIKPVSGNWYGRLMGMDISVHAFDVNFNINKHSQNISGILKITYSHFLNWEGIHSIDVMEDSLRSLQDQKPWREYIRKKIKQEHEDEASFDESYPLVGHVTGDSVYFQIDTIYPGKWVNSKKKQRHYRFQGKCMKATSAYYLESPNYFIMGNFKDSTLQQWPEFGTFILNKR